MQIPYLCQAANIVFMDQVKGKKTGTQTSTSPNGLDITTYRNWYETMLRIRRFEERALKMYSVNKIRGFLHVYIGQEAIAGAITSALRPTDPIVTAYRQHGIALCRGISSNACMAELFGKETGINKGKGGSVILQDGTELEVSTRRKEEFLKKMAEL